MVAEPLWMGFVSLWERDLSLLLAIEVGCVELVFYEEIDSHQILNISTALGFPSLPNHEKQFFVACKSLWLLYFVRIIEAVQDNEYKVFLFGCATKYLVLAVWRAFKYVKGIDFMLSVLTSHPHRRAQRRTLRWWSVHCVLIEMMAHLYIQIYHSSAWKHSVYVVLCQWRLVKL